MLRKGEPWLVFGLAAVLRLFAIDLAAFTYDDADAILRARAAVQQGLPLAGAMTSWGVPDPPLLVYVLATVAWVPSPALASLALMAAINALTVLGTYFVVRRFLGRRCALMASLLYAVNPWAIYFGRRAWIEVQPALTLLSMWAALEVVVPRQARFAMLFFVALAAGAQARLLALAYLPAALASLALGGRVWLSRWSLLGIAAGGLLSVPFLVYAVSSREALTAALAEGNRGVAAGPRHTTLEFAWWVASGLNLLPTPPLTVWLDRLGAVLRLESILAGFLLAVGLILCLWRSVQRGERWRCYALLLAWAVLPLALVSSQSSTSYLHYLVLWLPLPFILVALPLDWLLAQPRVVRALGLLVFLGVALPQLATWWALQRVLSTYSTDERAEATLAEGRRVAELARQSGQLIGTGESYGVEIPLRYWLAAASRVEAEQSVGKREVLIATNGTDPLTEERPALLEAVLGPDVPHRYLSRDSVVLPLARSALLLITSDVELPVSPERLGQRRALIPLPTPTRNARDGIRIFDLPNRPASEWIERLNLAPQQLGPSGLLALDSPDRARPGEDLDILTLWAGPWSGTRVELSIQGEAEQRLAEKQETPRVAVSLADDELVLIRHRIQLPSRLSPAGYVLVADLSRHGVGPERLQLTRITVR